MRKNSLLLVTSAMLLLSACNGGGENTSSASSNSSSSDSASASVSSSEEGTASSSLSVETSFTITYVADSEHPDTEVGFHYSDKDLTEIENGSKVEAGTIVLVDVWSEKETITGVFANGTELAHYQYSYYQLTMPEKNVVITLSYGEKGGETTSHSLIYVEDSAHPTTSVTFASSLDDIYSDIFITTAEAGDTVLAYVSTQETISEVLVNGTKGTQDSDYGWMLTSFTMPSEDAVITISYAASASAVELKCAEGVSCEFFADLSTALSSIIDGVGSTISTASVGDTIIVSFGKAESKPNHVYNGTGDNKTQLIGAVDSDYGDLTTYGIYTLNVPSTGVYITID